MAAHRVAVCASLAAARLLHLGRCRLSPVPRSALSGAAMEPAPRWLAGLRFDNRALRALPVETPPAGPEGASTTPRLVPGACFTRVRPTPLRQPRLVALSEPALALLGLGAPPAPEAEAEAALFFSGNALLPGAEPAAHCYCGHQFGHFAGQLGDGAAMYLGEVCTAAGERWELQLKGAGPTPFSRGAGGSSPPGRPCFSARRGVGGSCGLCQVGPVLHPRERGAGNRPRSVLISLQRTLESAPPVTPLVVYRRSLGLQAQGREPE
ncbi:hypothetical protein P7K49_003308 [Saguinus oedipus]|uniref:Selenoprotein O n=1 Tax=Saguinus oedipus TaxID=9490 RepID=A0ABQ9WJT6_SAGOE|nr:hypothetical protein P7K49_003308 [Saguinus oedipus]